MEDNITLKKLATKNNETLVLFLNDCNGYERLDPKADLVAVSDFVFDTVQNSERQQVGVERLGGNWKKALESSKMDFRIIVSGKKSEFSNEPFSYEYKVISGNY